MKIADKINSKIKEMPVGMVFGIQDFQVDMELQPTVVRLLNRRVKEGVLLKVSKGKYYKPKETVFGNLLPSAEEIAKDLLEKDGRIVGYITGTTAFAEMGLTTQISSSIVIGVRKYKRATTRAGINISFMVQQNEISEENIPLLRVLDAIRMLDEIPATTPDECIQRLMRMIKALDGEQQELLVKLSLEYKPRVRALLGAIIESCGLNADDIRKTLNGVTTYKLDFALPSLPNRQKWNII